MVKLANGHRLHRQHEHQRQQVANSDTIERQPQAKPPRVGQGNPIQSETQIEQHIMIIMEMPATRLSSYASAQQQQYSHICIYVYIYLPSYKYKCICMCIYEHVCICELKFLYNIWRHLQMLTPSSRGDNEAPTATWATWATQHQQHQQQRNTSNINNNTTTTSLFLHHLENFGTPHINHRSLRLTYFVY